MSDHNTETMSESEQMYLLTLAMLVEDGVAPPVPLTALAHARSIQPVSVNQMVRKLADADLVTYTPYKGVALTDSGQAIARRMLRYRRLWEVFLVEKLSMPAGEADLLACRFEHLTSDDVAARLAHFLGDPQMSPQGKLIPRQDTAPNLGAAMPLSELPLDEPAQVERIGVEDAARMFLAAAGLRIGSRVAVLAAGPGGALLLDIGGHTTRLAAGLAQQIDARPLATPAAAGARSIE